MGCCETLWDTIRITFVLCIDPFSRLFRACFANRKKSIKGEIVLVTGAGHGLGKELALKLSELDPILILWDINEENNISVANEIRTKGHIVHTYTVDVTNFNNVAETARRVQQEVGDVTILVNNAGVFSGYPLVKLPEHVVRRCFDVNVMGHFWILQQFLPKMIELNKGHVIAIASIAGHVGVTNMSDYCASKHAVVGMMNSLYFELRAEDHHVKLTTINPIIISTGLISTPETRFPSLMPVLTVDKTAREVLECILKEKDEVFIPQRVQWLLRFTNMFSRAAQFKIYKYIQYGFDSHKHVYGKVETNPVLEV